VLEQQQRRLVRPVQVVEVQYERLRRRCVVQELSHALEQPHALRLRVESYRFRVASAMSKSGMKNSRHYADAVEAAAQRPDMSDSEIERSLAGDEGED
jgi:hypothetical protein